MDVRAFRCGLRTSRVAANAVAALVCALLVCVALPLCSPQKAFAWFNEVTDSNPAAQALGAYGAPIDGSQLPDGTYEVTAPTSSRMCVLYTNPADADARTPASKEKAIVIAEGGTLTAMFYISKAYTHLYWGTQEEAAAATNEDGTDPSAYIPGDPEDGYVPHLFALPIPALNTPLTLSAYSGGDHGWEEGKWYTREVVFIMTDAELEAAIQAAAGDGGDQPPDNPDDDSGTTTDEGNPGSQEGDLDNGQTSDGNVDDGSQVDPGNGDDDASSDDGDGEQGSGDGDDSDSDGSKEGSDDQAALTEDNVSLGDSEEDSGQTGGQNYTDDEPEQPDSQNQQANQTVSKESTPAEPAPLRGVRMNIVSPEGTVTVDVADPTDVPEVEKPLFTPQQMLAIAIAIAFALGLGLRVLTFFRGYESEAKDIVKPPSQPVIPGVSQTP